MDGIVEINGKVLILEWKPSRTGLTMGQRIMYERITKNEAFVVFVVCGNAESMSVESYLIFFQGIHGDWIDSNLEELKERICSWAKWARNAR